MFPATMWGARKAEPRRISSIEFQGNRYYSQSQMLEWVTVKPGSVVPDSDIKALAAPVIEHYRDDGFYFARIDSSVETFSDDSAFVAMRFWISEGERSLLSALEISGNTAFSAENILRNFETAVGVPLHQSQLEDDIENLLHRYENAGYPFTKISIDTIRLDSSDRHKLVVHLRIREGPRVYLTEISVKGNTLTKNDVLVREAFLSPHELYNQDHVDRIRNRLERLGIFSSVSDPQLYLLSDPTYRDSVNGGLLLTVAEGNDNTFDGIAGYVPGTLPGQKGYLTGDVLVSMRNLFGTGRKLNVQWQRDNEVTQELSASYVEPWVAGFPVNAGVSIDQRKQDSSYVKSQYGLTTDLTLTDELSVGASLSDVNVYPSTLLSYFTVFQSNVLSFGGQIHYDTRNSLQNTTSGVYYATSYERGEKNISGPAQFLSLAPQRNFLIEQFSVDMEFFVPTFTRQVIAAGVHGRKISSDLIEVSDMFQLGGTNTLRGYAENQFYGSQIAWSNLEYRLLLGKLSSAFVFFDTGFFSRPSIPDNGITAQKGFRYGYGTGVRVETSLGVLGISFALGEGDSFGTAKIHFGVANEF
jgi:outer membrane protein assembly factor BamA